MPPWAVHPAFAPYRGWLALAGDEPPPPAVLAAWAREIGATLPDGRPLTFEPADRALDALGYERAIAASAVVPVCPGSWHDAFNALAWLALPRTKAALNAIHVRAARAATPNGRSRERDAATLVDESGLLLACDDERLPRLLRDHAWKRLFLGDAEAVVERCRAVVVGHGMLDKLRRPYRSLTAKVLVVTCEPGTLPAAGDMAAMDALAAAALALDPPLPAQLAALPVAALPGWDSEALGASLFDDASVFRPKVLRSSS